MDNLVTYILSSFNPPPPGMLFGFGILFLLFLLVISIHLFQSRRAKKAFEHVRSQYQFLQVDNISIEMRQAIQRVITSYFSITSDIQIEKIYQRGKDTDSVILFDVTYTMEKGQKTTWYIE